MAPRLQIQKRSPVSTFHPFKRLPFELRSKIWLLYDFPPRIVEIFFKLIPPSSDPPDTFINPSTCIYRVTSPTKPPPLAFINSESRAEIKRIYKTLDFGPGFYFPCGIYVDFRIDTVHLSAIAPVILSGNFFSENSGLHPPINLRQCPQLSQLRRLAIGQKVYSCLQFPSFLATHCPNLTTLIIPFQKTTLHDIKPASEYETLTFMDDSEYFAVGNAYTQSLFSADLSLRVNAGQAWLSARNVVTEDFWKEADFGQERSRMVGVVKSKRIVEGTRIGGTSRVVDYEVEIGGRKVDLKFVVALYPREKKFEGLKTRLSMNGV